MKEITNKKRFLNTSAQVENLKNNNLTASESLRKLMNEKAANKNFMTVKEVAKILGVSKELVIKRIRELFPDKMKERTTTYLNEKEVTIIKLRIQENSSLISVHDHTQSTSVRAVKTELEKKLLTKQVIQFLQEDIEKLEKENEYLLIKNKHLIEKSEIMRPKAESFDKFLDSSGLHSIGEIAKNLNYGPKKLFEFLRKENIFYKKNGSNFPYQQYINNGNFILKEKIIENGTSKPVIFATSKGFVFIEKLLKRIKNESNNQE